MGLFFYADHFGHEISVAGVIHQAAQAPCFSSCVNTKKIDFISLDLSFLFKLDVGVVIFGKNKWR